MRNLLIRVALGAIVLVAVTPSPPAHADNDPLWQTIGQWKIRMVPDIQGCYMDGIWEDGTSLRVGLNNSGRTMWLILTNQSWQSVVKDQPYNLVAIFPDSARYALKATGTVSYNKFKGIMARDLKAEFMIELAQQPSVKFFLGGKLVVGLNLPDNGAAMQSTMQCQHAFDTAAPSKDPFTGAADPFRRS
jgi:hypothetical protein